jgi:hypothetical protein
MKRRVFALAFMAAFGAFSRAEAQELGSNPAPQDDTEVSTTTISLGWARGSTPYNLARIGFDYMIIDKLSIGGALLYSNMDAEVEGGGEIGITDFAISPRVGYLHMFGKVVGIWPRGGLGYYSTSSQEGPEFDAYTIVFNAECMFPIVLAGHFGILAGFAFDQSLTGNYDPDPGPERDIMMRSIALQVGLFGWL